VIRETLSNQCGSARDKFPAPVISNVNVSDLTGNRHPQPWNGLIDTGADSTAVPLVICDDLKLTPRNYKPVHGFDHSAPVQNYPRYYVHVDIAAFFGFDLLVYGVPERSNILLGRDFLSQLVFLLDSPRKRYVLGKHTCLSKLILPMLRLS
jgi:hypothetical protein